MGFKRKLNIGIAFVLLFSIVLVIIYSTTLKKEKNYSVKLISVLNEQQEAKVQDVFLFEFARAYVFDDPYISGEGFAKKYNLNISINKVQSGVSENIQRIVFVDELGDFVYEFKCNNSEIFFWKKG